MTATHSSVKLVSIRLGCRPGGRVGHLVVCGAKDRDRLSEKATHYQVLQVPFGATDGEIRKRYRELQKKYHPDIIKDGGEKSAALNLAYTTLMDGDTRNDYEQLLR
ncbi:hypothetical protein CYMTET_29958 [Cymbomonas tetramitiformis]|uniref:J domain-containing protein n=1 Tax=Cymbomonas tetramitiformis TaxID=36881 RepID=A0AAE0KUN3_9CHLO|nr:hypothetical protein CYMTET_29958 [Cymbomonas tetramitiformis]